VEGPQNGPWNGGTVIAVGTVVNKRFAESGQIRVKEKSVFEVDDSRLAIGVFSRPLLAVEAKQFRQAWERDPMPGFGELELGRERISFVTPPENVPIAWKSIERFLTTASEGVRKSA
jgi:hypothetical protein